MDHPVNTHPSDNLLCSWLCLYTPSTPFPVAPSLAHLGRLSTLRSSPKASSPVLERTDAIWLADQLDTMYCNFSLEILTWVSSALSAPASRSS